MSMKAILLMLASFAALAAQASVKPNSLFSDNAVLQRGVEVPVWGEAAEGEKVTVAFAGQQVTTTAQHGKWMVKLKPLQAGGPFSMIITGDNEVVIKNILVGEVWVCSGQSNMERQLGPRPGQKYITDWQKERDAALYPEIRQYRVGRKPSPEPVNDAHSKWVVCSPATASDFSAVGYFFARDLYRQLKVPVGLLFSAVGGTPAEHWTSYETLAGDSALKRVVQAYEQSLKQYPSQLEKYKQNEATLLAQYTADTALARAQQKPLPRKPASPGDPRLSGNAGGLYNGMIRPLQPYAIKGVIWYQGEANRSNASFYRKLFPAMIASWRKEWGQGMFPFLFVQVAPYKDMTPDIREAQFLTSLSCPNTAMAVTIDCGDSADIHPSWKQPVGARLALAARALAYGEKVDYVGPVYQKMTIKGDAVILSFTHARELVAKDGELSGFVIAGPDKVFVPARALIKGRTIVVTGEGVAKPVAVRYGWSNVPHVNLYNEAGLPASPFRTDF